jgi:thymidylate kinase
MEENFYQKMVLPDQLIVLRADPEIAVKRKTEEDEFSVRARSSEIWEMDWKQTQASVINANKPKEEVSAVIKNLIWSIL